MDVANTVSSGYTGASWKEEMLQGNTSKAEQANQLAAEFEGVLLRQFLQKALKPMDPENGYFSSKSSPMYEQLVQDALVSGITNGGSLGFSSVVQAQLFPNDKTLEEGTASHE